MKKAALVPALLVAAMAACGSEGTQPVVPFEATATELAEAGAAVDDAAGRLAGSLSDQQFATELRGPLAQLAAQVAANRADRAGPALTLAQTALNGSAAGAPAGDAPDRAAISLALTHIERLLAR